MKKKLFAALLAAMVLGSSFSVCAAPQYMADGNVFDADWYRAQNPDIAAAFPEGTSAGVLYQHYTGYGAAEGRTPYNPVNFDPASVLPYQEPSESVSSTKASGKAVPAESFNKDMNNYGVWSKPVNSYLYENPAGGLTRVEYLGGQIVVEDYDNNFKICSSRSIPMELPLWGGFYAGKNYNFVMVGQENYEENDSKEVVRVIKYSKDWQRLGHTSLCGANTVAPFDAGSLRCAEYGDYLYIRTCHSMYKSSRDGLNHQANMTLAVRQSDMALTDSHNSVAYSGVGYASHSFNQFVLVDQNQNIVTVDHGDAYPRSIVLMRYNGAKGGGDRFSGSVSESTLMNFPGAIGQNYTGASLGGLAETANGYVTAFAYNGDAGMNDLRAIYVGFTGKDGLGSTATPITDVGMGTPVLVPTGLDGGYLMWTDINDNFYYTRYTDGGAVGTTGTANAALSDCQPICHNGEVIWYVTNGSVPTFYKLNPATGITAVRAKSGK